MSSSIRHPSWFLISTNTHLILIRGRLTLGLVLPTERYHEHTVLVFCSSLKYLKPGEVQVGQYVRGNAPETHLMIRNRTRCSENLAITG